MQVKEMTCIRCPLGCALKAVTEEDGNITVTGNTCGRGAEYARNELTNPRRMVTSTVRIRGRKGQMVSVKTAGDIPKGKIMECMEALRQVEVALPVKIGDVLVKDIAGTGVDIVATNHVE